MKLESREYRSIGGARTVTKRAAIVVLVFQVSPVSFSSLSAFVLFHCGLD